MPESVDGKRHTQLSKDEKLNFWLKNNWTEKYSNDQKKLLEEGHLLFKDYLQEKKHLFIS